LVSQAVTPTRGPGSVATMARDDGYRGMAGVIARGYRPQALPIGTQQSLVFARTG
jgi:hypothetical protein